MKSFSMRQGAVYIFKTTPFLGLLTIVVSAFVFGFSIQAHWIAENCASIPFFTNGPGACRENILRLLLGGALFSIVFLLLFIASFSFAIRNNEALRAKSVLFKSSLCFVFLIFSGLNWAIEYDFRLYLLSIILTFSGILYLSRNEFLNYFQEKIPSYQGDLHWQINKNYTLMVIKGHIIQESATRICDQVLWHIPTDLKLNEFRFDISQLGKVDKHGLGLFLMLISMANIHGKPWKFIGNEERSNSLLDQLSKQLLSDKQL